MSLIILYIQTFVSYVFACDLFCLGLCLKVYSIQTIDFYLSKKIHSSKLEEDLPMKLYLAAAYMLKSC